MLSYSISSLLGTSPLTINKLKSFGIETFFDLLNHFPSRYENYSTILTVNALEENRIVTLRGVIEDSTQLRTRRGLKIQKFILKDPTGKIDLTWYNQPYLLTILKMGTEVSVSGLVRRFGNRLTIEPAEFEVLRGSKKTIHTGRLVPIYPETRGLSSKILREKIFSVLKNNLEEVEFLPKKIMTDYGLIDEKTAYWGIHFPNSYEALEKARGRLAFDEIFIMQLFTALIRQEWSREKVSHLLKQNKTIEEFKKNLPFLLTNAQKKVTNDILGDLTLGKPMNRFLQGEVGSGKTIVAAIACYLTYLNGYRSLFMAPTEILAQQHYRTMTQLFSSKKLSKTPIISLVTSSNRPNAKELKRADIIVGTHALISSSLEFDKVAFVIVDEQHRFGVAQRAMLKKKGINPHLLTMTATPIPRTVALTIFGELDLSVIDELPKGRVPVKTYLVPKTKRPNCYRWIAEKIKKEKVQVFIICPLIEESDKETMRSVRAAKKEYESLKSDIFPNFSVALLHGKLKSKEKNQIMTDFRNKKHDILVSTSVVEVGVDIPNATIMVIEGAERYGLSQLHQLRGRVGRGSKESYCFLFSEVENKKITERLNFFTKNANGAQLAEYDLVIRGPGELYGVKQHGYTQLKIAAFSDYEIIEQAKKATESFLNGYRLEDYKGLKNRLSNYQAQKISKD